MRPDPELPQVPSLLGPEAGELVSLALRPAGLEVLHVAASQVRYVPGRRIVVRYATRVRPSGGRERTDTTVAVADRDGPPPGAAVLAGPGGHVVGVWRYPHDPHLPALATVADAGGARSLLAQLGLPAERVRVRPVVYRPGRRAVLHLLAERPGGGAAALYAKVVRPHRAERIQRVHEALSPCAPVPRTLGWSGTHGLVVLEALPGDRLAGRLAGGGPLPQPRALLAPLDAIAGVELPPAPARTGAAVDAHAELLRAVVPGERGLVEEVAGFAAAAGLPADRTVHGDFYEGQVLVRGREVSGLLDVDGARRGDAVEDVATLLAHLDGLAHVRPGAAGRIRGYRRAVERHALRRAVPEALRPAVAGVLLGLCTGPFRLQEPGWPERTRAWLRLAGARLAVAGG